MVWRIEPVTGGFRSIAWKWTMSARPRKDNITPDLSYFSCSTILAPEFAMTDLYFSTSNLLSLSMVIFGADRELYKIVETM